MFGESDGDEVVLDGRSASPATGPIVASDGADCVVGASTPYISAKVAVGPEGLPISPASGPIDVSDGADSVAGAATPCIAATIRTSATAAAALCSAVSDLDLGPAERALYQSDRFWWHELVHSGLRHRIAAYSGIVWKMPERHEDPLIHCMRVIRRLAGNTCCYYVGITESPIRRWEAHCTKYTTMYLLYVAETSRTTAAFEMSILRQIAFGSLMFENDSFGGESASSASPHYLYVVTRESGLLRGSYRAPRRSRMRANIMDDLQGIYR